MARAMKESGIEWIGQIPENWEIKKLKYACETRRTKYNRELGELDYFGLENIVSESGEFISTSNEYDLEQSQLCMKNDVVFGKLRPYLAKVFLVDKDRCCSGEFAVFTNFDGVELFYKYLFLSYGFIKIVDASTYGTKMPRASIDFINNMYIPVPPSNMQRKIANFLSDKVGEINAIISKTKESVDEYKKLKQSIINESVIKGLDREVELKKSDIEFVDTIPAHWSEIKNNFLFRENVRPYCEGDIPLSLSQVDGLIPTADMKESSLKTSSYDNWKKVVVGDLVLNRFKAHLGVLFASTLEGMVSFHYGVYEPQRKLVTKYYEYLYHSDYYKAIYAGMSNGMVVGLQNLSNANFYAVKSIYPPFDEQMEIVAYLDKKCTEIDALIAKKEAFVKEMEVYKKSLIYEYVTGKKEVL